MSFPQKILLGVSGGIAAYKSPGIVRRLRERGAEVQVVMTAGAKRFITPLTLQAVSGNPVRDGLWDEQAEAAMGHIELARWADLILIAPATADLIAKLADGKADDLLTTLCLASEAPVTVAPAMNQQMWNNTATQANCDTLLARGIRFLGPDSGDQACGEVGPGRMLEPEAIAKAIMTGGALSSRKVIVTAGPTREALDPVRFISNRSSGRMGFSLAQAAAELGADVVLVAGPVMLPAPAGVTRINVETAMEMKAAVESELGGCDVFIASAAVSDFAVADPGSDKIKKSGQGLNLELTATPDILAEVAAGADRPFCVGFAAETKDLTRYAMEKLEKKNLDMICANEVGAGRGFDVPENALSVFWAGGSQEFELQDKLTLARRLVTLIAERYGADRYQAQTKI